MTIELPKDFYERGYDFQPDEQNPEQFRFTWPKDTLVSALGGVLVGCMTMMVLCAPILVHIGQWQLAIINAVIGMVLAPLFHRMFFSKQELLLAKGRLVIQRTWRNTVEQALSVANPLRVALDGVCPPPPATHNDDECQIEAPTADGKWVTLLSLEKVKAERLTDWLNKTIAQVVM